MYVCSICTADVLKFGNFFYCPCCLATIDPKIQEEEHEEFLH